MLAVPSAWLAARRRMQRSAGSYSLAAGAGRAGGVSHHRRYGRRPHVPDLSANGGEPRPRRVGTDGRGDLGSARAKASRRDG